MITNANHNTRWSFPGIIYIILIICVIGLVAIMASVPPVSRDALIHHLAIPKLYLQHGSIFEIPDLHFTYYPMNVTLLYGIPLYFNNDILAKFIHFSFALGTAAMVYWYLIRRLNKTYALLGSLFFLSIPIIVYQSTIVYVDLGLVCFLFASILFIFKWIEAGFKFKYLAISALLCGLALGTKYNGLVGLFLLGMFVPFIYARYHANESYYGRRAVFKAAAFIVIALLLFSPWMIRNVVWTGNPIYPLYNSVIGSAGPGETVKDNEREGRGSGLSHFEIRRDLYGESTLEIMLIPLRVFFQGEDNNPKYFDGRANPFLLLLSIVAFFGIRQNSRQVKTEKFILAAFSVLFLLFAIVQTSIRIRYFIPIFPPLVILSMYGLFKIEAYFQERSDSISSYTKHIAVYGIIVVMLGLNAKYMLERWNYVTPMPYLTGEVTRDQYIQKFRPEYASMQYANRNLSEDDRILGIYVGNRGYYSDIDITFSLRLLQNLADQSQAAKEITDQLRERDISYLLINFGLFNHWVQQGTLHQQQLLKDFFEEYVDREFSHDGYGLYRVKNDNV